MTAPSPTMSGVHKVWLLIAIAIIGGALVGFSARAIMATGQGADFGDVLNEPARSADGTASIAWAEGEPLLRAVEPETQEAIEFAWTRAISAVGMAAADGNTAGVDVWFSGPAQDQLHQLLATGTVVDGGAWVSHEITPDFYSIDGQILVAQVERTAVVAIEAGEAPTDVVRVVFVLRDGNWRIEHLVRQGDAS